MFTLDAYAARNCPSKVHNAFHPGFEIPKGVASLPMSSHSAEFKTRVADQVSFIPGAVDIRPLHEHPSAVQEAALAEAVAAGARVIISPLLPRDWEGHRAGRPDFLVRGEDRPDGGAGYLPAQVKFHRVLEERRGAIGEVSVARLARPWVRRSIDEWRYRAAGRLADTLQLAHYWRLLQAIGLDASDGPWAALVGTDELPEQGLAFSWAHLGESQGPGGDGRLPSALDCYDEEHVLRVDLAERARALAAGDDPIFRPVLNRECPRCPWRDVCESLLGEDDLSVRISKAPLDINEILTLRTLGIATVSDLALTDLDSLLPEYLPRVCHRTGTEERLRLAQRRARMIVEGVELERVTTGPIPGLAAHEVEVDLDIETSTTDRVYLWGFQVTDAHGSSYTSFAEFRDLNAAAEGALADRAMAWLRELAAHHDVAVYHYSDYETVRLRRLASDHRLPDLAWSVGWAKEHFVDLFAMVRPHFFGTQGLGLKAVASAAAGFHWRDPDPGGLNSMAWFNDAVHADTQQAREAARRRVLEYNEDDVRATRELRRWLRSLA
jgi:predicted RecB family nuclease